MNRDRCSFSILPGLPPTAQDHIPIVDGTPGRRMQLKEQSNRSSGPEETGYIVHPKVTAERFSASLKSCCSHNILGASTLCRPMSCHDMPEPMRPSPTSEGEDPNRYHLDSMRHLDGSPKKVSFPPSWSRGSHVHCAPSESVFERRSSQDIGREGESKIRYRVVLYIPV